MTTTKTKSMDRADHDDLDSADMDGVTEQDAAAEAALAEEATPADEGKEAENGQASGDSVAEPSTSSWNDLPTREQWEERARTSTASPRQFQAEYLERRLYAALMPLSDVVDAAAEADLDPATIRVLTQKAMEDELAVPMLPISPGGHGAEVGTPAMITVTAYCPNCGLAVTALVRLFASLNVEPSKSELKVKGKTDAVKHVCYQQTLGMAPGEVVEGQVGMDDAIAEASDADDAFDNEGTEAIAPDLDPVQVAVALQEAGFRFSASAVQAWSAEDRSAALEYVASLATLEEGAQAPEPPAVLAPPEDAKPKRERARKHRA